MGGIVCVVERRCQRMPRLAENSSKDFGGFVDLF